MSKTDPAFIGPPIAAAVGAVLTIAAAVPTIEERLGRVRDIELEIGRLPRLVDGYYVVPQYIYKWGLILMTFVGFVMVGAFAYRFVYPTAWMPGFVQAFGTYGLWLIIVWFVLGTAMYTNSFSRLAIWFGVLFTLPPLLRSVWGTDRLDRHPAWPALNAFVNGNKGAKPLIINEATAKGFADDFIQKLDKEAKPAPNRAAAPVLPPGTDLMAFRQTMSNALLMGCIVEEAHYAPAANFPKRDWGPFYNVVQELALGTDFLTAQNLRNRRASNDMFSKLLTDLNQRLEVHAQPPVPASPTLIENLNSAFNTLAERYDGNAAAIDPQNGGFCRTRWDIIRARVNSLPGLRSEAMRAQFVKLAVVWGIWTDLPFSGFDFAFSKRIAALLLDRAVIRVPSDMKVLTFDTREEQQVGRAAEKIVIAETQRLVENDRRAHAAWLPPQSRDATGELFRWWVAYEIDLRLWDYAKRLHENKDIAADDGLTRWRANGQVARVAKS